MDFATELTAALAAAEKTGQYVRAEYETFAQIPDAKASISTHVDRGAQEIILKHLRAAFPADGLVAEETTPALANAPTNADRVWVVDPIDGTRGFAMKNGEFSVMIGLTVGGRPVVGVVLEPVLDRYTYATAGSGCWVRSGTGLPTRCQVTSTAVLSDAVLVQSHTKPGATPKPVVRALAPRSIHETYSAGIKLAVVARGEADLYVNDYTGFHDWDVCAGHILVEEAGGRMSLFDGSPVTYGAAGAKQRRGMVASNGRLHDDVVGRLAGV